MRGSLYSIKSIPIYLNSRWNPRQFFLSISLIMLVLSSITVSRFFCHFLRNSLRATLFWPHSTSQNLGKWINSVKRYFICLKVLKSLKNIYGNETINCNLVKWTSQLSSQHNHSKQQKSVQAMIKRCCII